MQQQPPDRPTKIQMIMILTTTDESQKNVVVVDGANENERNEAQFLRTAGIRTAVSLDEH